MRGLRLLRWEMCVKAESFDVEEEVGWWSTDGRWMVSAPPQHQDRSLLKVLLGTLLLLLLLTSC